MNYKKNVFLLTLLLFQCFMLQANIDQIRTQAKVAFLVNLLDEYEQNPGDASQARVALRGLCIALLDGQQPEGHFDPIYLNDEFPDEQLSDLVLLCQAYALMTEPSLDALGFTLELGVPEDYFLEDLEAGIISGLNWWYQHVPYYNHAGNNGMGVPSSGWWWNEIGKQRELQMISILFFDYLDDPDNENNILLTIPGTSNPAPIAPPVYDVVTDCSEDPIPATGNISNLRDAISADFQISIQDLDGGAGDNHTGANKADVASSIIAKGLLDDCQNYIDLGKEALECVMYFATEEQKRDGVREDYSFNQHNKENQSGPNGVRRGFLYSGGYGMSFMHNVAVWGVAFQGDAVYDYESVAKQNFFNYLLEGYRWMLIGGMTDYSANGRDIAKKFPSSNARITNEDMALIVDMAAGSGALADLVAMQSQLGGHQIIGSKHHKHFWKSDYVCHQEANYFSSVRMCSDRTLGTEEHEGDNKLGFWLPYGCTFIYQDGDEYIRSADENIFPFWDWYHVPGVTCSDGMNPETDLLPVNNENNGQGNTQTETFVGNASNDSYGVSTMIYDKDYYGGTVTAQKAWFHFGDEVIALGAGITGNELYTTVNQCLLDGDVSHTSVGNNLGNGATTSGSIPWVRHDEIGYIFPGSQTVHLSNVNQSGSWDDINGGDNNTLSGSVFKAWIDHDQQDSYYYRVVPGLTSDLVASTYNTTNPLTVVNQSDLQWVRKDDPAGNGLAGIIYYEAPLANTFINVSTAVALRADQPCVLLYDESSNEVCISSPSREVDEVNLEININGTITERRFTLPIGEYAGKSRCIDITTPEFTNVCNSCPTGMERTEFDGGLGTSSSDLGLGDLSDECISIAGKVIIDAEYTWDNVTVYLDPGAEIEINRTGTLTAENCTFESCSNMWKGITIKNEGNLIFNDNSISDAQYAITAHGGSSFEALGNIFDRNYVGIFVPTPTLFYPNYLVNNVEKTFPANPTGSTGNRFVCSDVLNAPYAGQHPAPGNITYAGMLLRQVNHFQIGMEGFKAEFDGLRNGIIAYNSMLDIQADITNLDGEDLGTANKYGFGTNDHNGLGIYLINSYGLSLLNTNIENAFIGLYTSHVDLDGVDNCDFINLERGIHFIGEGGGIDQDTGQPDLSGDGYRLLIGEESGMTNQFRCNEAIVINNANRCNIRITNNEIRRPVGSDASIKGISISNSHLSVQGGSIVDDGGVADIFDNHVFFEGQNTGGFDNGFEVIDCSYVRLKNNWVTETTAPGNRLFYAIYGNENCQIRENHGVSTAGSSQATGMLIVNTTSSVYCCNEFQNIANGMDFNGTCTETKLRGTSFDGTTVNALRIGFGTRIGIQGDEDEDQFLPGNIWSGGMGETVHLGNEEDVENSLIYYDDNVTGSLPNPAPESGGEDWFILDDLMRPTITCPTNPDCEIEEVNFSGDDGPIKEIDIKIADGPSTTIGIYDGGVQFEDERYLFRKISHGSLQGQNATVDNFYNNNMNSAIGQFHAIGESMKNLYDPTNPITSEILTKRETLYGILQRIRVKNELLATLPPANQEPVRLEKTLLLQNLNIINQDLMDLVKVANENKQIAVEGISIQNNAISATTTFEQNRKTINDLYLNTIASGIFEFNPAQLAQIKGIADQCPLYGGNAVFQARGMLKIVMDETTYDDESICTQVKKRNDEEDKVNKIAETNQLKVYPSPSNGKINIILDEPISSNQKFELFDLSGKQVGVFLLRKGQSEFRLDLSDWESGIYFYECNMSQKSHTGKIILID